MHVPQINTLPYLHVLVHVEYLRNNEVTRWAGLRLLKWVDNFINIFVTEKNLLQNILKFLKVLKQWIVLGLITYVYQEGRSNGSYYCTCSLVQNYNSCFWFEFVGQTWLQPSNSLTVFVCALHHDFVCAFLLKYYICHLRYSEIQLTFWSFYLGQVYKLLWLKSKWTVHNVQKSILTQIEPIYV